MTVKLPKDVEGRETVMEPDTGYHEMNDVFERIADLIDRGECENEMGACDNGCECSVCGCRVEDEEHYHVSGTWNFCPQCGRKEGSEPCLLNAPNCGRQIDFHAGHINNGRVFVCEKGEPPSREVKYHRGNCDSTIIFIEKCEPKEVDRG